MNGVDPLLALEIMFMVTGLILAALSLPMIAGRIPPNGLYGFRVKKTMENPDIWYPVNKFSGKWLLAAGISLVLVAFGLSLVQGISLDTYSLSVLAVWLIIFAIGLVASIRYLRSL